MMVDLDLVFYLKAVTNTGPSFCNTTFKFLHYFLTFW